MRRLLEDAARAAGVVRMSGFESSILSESPRKRFEPMRIVGKRVGKSEF